MAEKPEKSKQNQQLKHIPKDAQVIMSIMKDMDINEYEPRVINQLLEFTYKYVTCVLEDAKTYANHAKQKSIDLNDVKLALKIQLEQIFTATPPREIISEMSRAKNNIPLPLIKPHCGIRLPQDRYCLSSSNLKIKVPQVPKKHSKPQYSRNYDPTAKMTPKINVGAVKRTTNLPIVSRTQSFTVNRPVTKFTTVPPKAIARAKINIAQNSTPVLTDDEQINMLKRKRDDDYDM